MIKVGIIGGAGYTAGELIRILLTHPKAEIAYIQSTSNGGNPITDVHNDLFGATDLKFVADVTFDGIDVIFFCMGHGKAKEFFAKHQVPASVKVIDLGNDFRLTKDAGSFVYGLPEVFKADIKKANHIANPGCFATAIQLSLLPLAAKGLLKEVHIQATTGSTGAGQAPSETTHFSWRSNNLSVYKAFTHQHLGEIRQTLVHLQPDFKAEINFVPLRGNFPRGILASTYLECDLNLADAKALFREYYKDQPFVFLSDANIDLKQVVNTNKCILYLEKHGNKLLIISIIDNLTKGASGQAVQNMNLMFGLPENEGLSLKSVAF